MTSDLSPPAVGGEVISQLSWRQTGSQDGALVDLWVAVVFAGELGLGSELLLDPAGQRSEVRSPVCLSALLF